MPVRSDHRTARRARPCGRGRVPRPTRRGCSPRPTHAETPPAPTASRISPTPPRSRCVDVLLDVPGPLYILCLLDHRRLSSCSGSGRASFSFERVHSLTRSFSFLFQRFVRSVRIFLRLASCALLPKCSLRYPKKSDVSKEIPLPQSAWLRNQPKQPLHSGLLNPGRCFSL